jgi:hypothetical protein
VNAETRLEVIRTELESFADGRRQFTQADAQVFIDQTAAIIRAIVGSLPARCAVHLAQASYAAAAEELPRFIHEIEAALMLASRKMTT